MLNVVVSLSPSSTLSHGSVVVTVDGSRKSETPLSNHDPRTAVQLRTALKRLKEIMEGKSQVRFLTYSCRLNSISASLGFKKNQVWILWLPDFRTVTWSSTGCRTASVKNVMTAMKSSQLSAAATIADCVVRFSAVAAATRKFPESSWVTQVRAVLGMSHKSLSSSNLIKRLAHTGTSYRAFSAYSGHLT